MRKNKLYVTITQVAGKPQAALLYLDHHLEDEPDNTPTLSLLAAADTLDALATHVGANYHSITASRSSTFIGNALPAKQLYDGTALTIERALHKEEFTQFWEKMQDAYSYRDGPPPHAARYAAYRQSRVRKSSAAERLDA